MSPQKGSSQNQYGPESAGSNSKKSAQNNKIMKKNQTQKPWEVDGQWTYFQNIKYVQFLEENAKIFESDYLRRVKKVFQKMARKICTRTSQQCRSHHQKMSQKYGSESQIISIMRSQLTEARCNYLQKLKQSSVENTEQLVKVQQVNEKGHQKMSEQEEEDGHAQLFRSHEATPHQLYKIDYWRSVKLTQMYQIQDVEFEKDDKLFQRLLEQFQ